MTAHKTTTEVPTAHGDKYLQQLCKHWSHNLTVELEPGRGRVIFPRDIRGAAFPGDASVVFTGLDQALRVEIEASAPEQLEGLKGVVQRHLDRFAFREAPLSFAWR